MVLVVVALVVMMVLLIVLTEAVMVCICDNVNYVVMTILMTVVVMISQ